MKKLISLILALVCIFALVGCFPENTVNIEFPFEIENVARVEMYHKTPSSEAEMKATESDADIKELYEKFESISFKIKENEEKSEPEITLFKFILSDGTEYDLTYLGYGVKNGRLKSTAGNFDYFTSADIAGIWQSLSKNIEATVESE